MMMRGNGLVLFKHPELVQQFLCSILGSISGVVAGAYAAYISVAIPSLEDDNEAPFQLSEEEKSLLVSIPSVGSILGALASIVLLPRFGRKTLLVIFQLPVLLAWCAMAWGGTFIIMFLSMASIGFCVGFLMPVGQVYLSEICSSDTRGFITGSTMLWQVFYNLVNYTLGGWTSWKTLAIINAAISGTYLVISIFTPESPKWLSMRGLTERARNVSDFLGICEDSTGKTVLISQDTPSTEQEDEKPVALDGNAVSRENSSAPFLSRDAENSDDAVDTMESSTMPKFRRSTIKPALILMVFIIFRQCTGGYTVLSYTVTIFKSAGGFLSPSESTIVIGVVQLAFVLMANTLTDTIGQKRLIVTSGIVMGLSQVVFGAYYFCRDHEEYRAVADQSDWIPLATLVIFIASFSVGFAPSLFVLMTELIPPERTPSWIPGMVSLVNGLSGFGILKCYYVMRRGLGQAGLFWLYGLMSVLAAIFCKIFLPEAKSDQSHVATEKSKQLTDP